MDGTSQIDGYWNPDDPFGESIGYTYNYVYKTKTKSAHLGGSLDMLSAATSKYVSHTKFAIPLKFTGWYLPPVSTEIQGGLYTQDVWMLDSIDDNQLTYKRLHVTMGMGLFKEDLEVLNSNTADLIFALIAGKITSAYAKIEKWVVERKAEVLKKFPWCQEKGVEPILFVETPGGVYYKTWIKPQW